MTRRDAPRPLGRPGRRPPAARRRPASWSGSRSGRHRPGPSRRATGVVAAPAIDEPLLAGLAALVGDDHVVTDDDLRRRRTRGKSTPDLLRSRAGDFADAPDAVVRPGRPRPGRRPWWRTPPPTGSRWCRSVAAPASPAAWPPAADGFAGLVSLDLGRMKRLLDVDPVSMTATLEPGLRGPEAEALLGAHGLTLGHFPQSFEFATIGGFAATRSSGQASAGFGRFDAMVVGLTAATPAGELRLGSAPASAAGPDLRQLLLGSEGTLGVITSRHRPGPPLAGGVGPPGLALAEPRRRRDRGADAGPGRAAPDRAAALRRGRDRVNLADPDADRSTGGERGRLPDARPATRGRPSAVAARRAAVTAVLAGLGGTDLGEEPGRAWAAGRYGAPYLRDALLDEGVLVETLETATFWSRLEPLHAAVTEALQGALDGALVLCHVSPRLRDRRLALLHRRRAAGDDPLAQWQAAKAAASDAIVAAGATITHHHAVGTDHVPWSPREIGPVGVAGAARRQGRPRPGRRPQPRRAAPVSPRPGRRPSASSSTRPPAAAPRPRRCVPVARLLRDAGAGVEVTYSPGPRAMRALVGAAVDRGDVVVSVGGDGMLSSLAGLVAAGRRRARRAARRSRQRLRADARPADHARGAGRAAARRARPARSTCSPADERASWPGSVYAGVDARAAEIVDRRATAARRAPVPLRRRPRRSRPTGPAATGWSVDGVVREVRRGDRRGRQLGLLRQGDADRPRRLGQRRPARRRRDRGGLPARADAGAAERLRRQPRRARRGAGPHGLAGRARRPRPGTPVPVGGDGEPLGTAAGRRRPAAAWSEVLPGALTVLAA